MQRLILRLAPLALLLLVVSGCGSSEDVPDTPTTPPTNESNVFTGTLAKNGAFSHTFNETSVGTVTAQLISLAPDTGAAIGLALGTWNGSICQIIVANDATRQGDVVIGQVTIPGQFCVRVYDAAGTVVEPVTYAVEVTHQ